MLDSIAKDVPAKSHDVMICHDNILGRPVKRLVGFTCIIFVSLSSLHTSFDKQYLKYFTPSVAYAYRHTFENIYIKNVYNTYIYIYVVGGFNPFEKY